MVNKFGFLLDNSCWIFFFSYCPEIFVCTICILNVQGALRHAKNSSLIGLPTFFLHLQGGWHGIHPLSITMNITVITLIIITIIIFTTPTIGTFISVILIYETCIMASDSLSCVWFSASRQCLIKVYSSK